MFLKKKTKTFLVLIIMAILVVWVIISSLRTDQPNPIQSDEPVRVNNNPVSFNSEEFRLPEAINPKGLNLIFFADQYSLWEDFENDIDVLMEEVKKVEPWKSYSLFNIYKINPKDAEGLCYIKIKDERKPVLRCRDEINNYLNILPLDKFKLIVLSRQDFQSWANVVRISNSGIFFSIPSTLSNNTDKKSYGILFLHLLGHSFGLKDEELIILAKYDTAVLTPDGPNCAPDVDTAQKWWGELALQEPERIGFFYGCSGNTQYVKPTQSSLMNLNDQSSFIADYGPVSELYLSRILKYCFTSGYYTKKNNPDFFKLYPEFIKCLGN